MSQKSRSLNHPNAPVEFQLLNYLIPSYFCAEIDSCLTHSGKYLGPDLEDHMPYVPIKKWSRTLSSEALGYCGTLPKH